MNALKLFIPISKVDEDKRLVYGVLTEETPDKSGEIFDYETGKKAISEWSEGIDKATQGNSKGNVRAMHGNVAAGKFTDIAFDDDNKRITGCAKIVDENEWNKVREGVYTGFSIGGGYAARWKDENDPQLMRYTPTISEVSIVDNPCVSTATFEYIKSDGSCELRKFNVKDSEMTIELQQVWQAKDSTTFSKKADAEQHNKALEIEETLLPSLSKLEAALKADSGDKKDTAEKNEKGDTDTEEEKAAKKKHKELEEEKAKKYAMETADKIEKNFKLYKRKYPRKDREKMAAEGDALPDGSYPIKTKEDLESAVQAYGSAKDKAKAKKHILDHAKALDAVKLLPKDWHEDGEADEKPDSEKYTKAQNIDALKKFVGKEVCDAGSAAQALMIVLQLMEGEESEGEGDAGEAKEQQVFLMQAASRLKQFIASEIMENDDWNDDSDSDDDSVQKLFKGGAKHSKSTKDALMELHKSASYHLDGMEKCYKAMGIMPDDLVDDGSGEGKDARKMSKALDALNTKISENLALSQKIADANEVMTKATQALLEAKNEISESRLRIEALENKPEPFKGNVRAVSKGSDGKSIGAEAVEDQLKKMSPDQRATLLTKVALKNGINY